MNKHIGILMTALLVLLMAGSAMCETDYVILENKNTTTWQPITGDGISANVTFETVDDHFNFTVTGNVGACGCYYLIYYADYEDRDNNYGGDNPGMCIASIAANHAGDIVDVTKHDFNINLPEPPDWNMQPDPEDEYCGDPDNYDHCCGAKLWIVPCDAYNDSSYTVTDWSNMDMFLFETDLIWFDDIDHNHAPEIIAVIMDHGCYEAGDEIEFYVDIVDLDGRYDLDNMQVTADLSEFGVEEPVDLTVTYYHDCIKAQYIGNAVVTKATVYGCYPGAGTHFDVYAEDLSGYSSTKEGELAVEPGPADHLNFTSIGYTTLLNWEYMEVNAEPPIWSIFRWWDFQLYFDALLVTCQDEFGNDRMEIGCDPVVTTTGHASIVHDEFLIPDYLLGLPGTLVIVWNSAAVETCTLTAFCEDNPEVTEATIDITFLEPIIQVNITSETDLFYSDGCSGCDCTDVSAQILDMYGDPIPMPNVPVQFYVYDHGDAWFTLEESYTNEDGIATSSICVDDDSPGSVEARAVAEARMGTAVIPIVEPELGSIVLYPEYANYEIGDSDTFNACCYSTHGSMMQCPNMTWSSTNEYVGTVEPHEDDDCCVYAEFFAHHSGITNITVCNGSICSDPMTAAVYGHGDSDCSEDNVTVVDDDVTFSVNFSEGGCAWIQAIGDPLNYYCDGCCNESDLVIVKGVYVSVDGDPENDTYTLTICYNATTLDVMGIVPGTLTILKCNTTDYENCTWEDVGGTDNGSCVTVELDHLCMFALAGVSTEDPCDGVECEDICIGCDLWSQVCVDGECEPYELIEVDSPECECECDGTEEGEKCYGYDLWHVYCDGCYWQKCELIEANSYQCGYSSGGGGSSSSGGGIYPPGWNQQTNATPNDTDTDGGNGTYPETDSADGSDDGGVVNWEEATNGEEGDEDETDRDEGQEMAPIAVPNPSTPGFAGLVGILAIIAMVLLLRNRRT